MAERDSELDLLRDADSHRAPASSRAVLGLQGARRFARTLELESRHSIQHAKLPAIFHYCDHADILACYRL
jgi:hypothetical protein